jgi:hypothetical protein
MERIVLGEIIVNAFQNIGMERNYGKQKILKSLTVKRLLTKEEAMWKTEKE